MSALLQLGLNHSDVESAAASAESQEWLDRLKTVDEWAKKVFEGIEKLPENFKNKGELGKILEDAAPWIKAASKVLPPAHLLLEVVSALTKINDPRDLAILACTVAYQSVADEAIREVGLPDGESVTKRLRDSIGMMREEFTYFTIEGALTHPFIRRADEVLEFYASQAGYEDRQIQMLTGTVHRRFREELRRFISDGKNMEKFAPLRNWLGIDAKDAHVRLALRRHVQYTRWLFEEAPLLDEEPYALQHIYIDTGCGVLTRKELQEKDRRGRPKRDPFDRDAVNGGEHSLVNTVLGYIRDPDFDDVIIIQGSAGAGKSSFAKHLAAMLAVDGLTPLLVRLRDAANIGQGLLRTIGDALRYEDQVYLQGAEEQFLPPAELFGNGTIFDERVPYYGVAICPCVLILDGWDEISLDVADGYKKKVQALLSEIRQEFFRRRHARVRVILTGRPSDAIDTAESFFNEKTPVLTVRQMTPEQLAKFADNVRAGVDGRPLPRYASNWEMPTQDKLEPLFAKYKEAFKNKSSGLSEQVLGVPFLAQLAFRVIADPGRDGDRVANDATTLLRRITEITVHHARLSAEYINVVQSPTVSDKHMGNRLHGDPLRRLLHRTAAKMTIVGRESVSHKELSDYLHGSNDEDLIEQAERAGGITGLLIAFFFKGGNTQLGCEFTHKALREYLFAEAVVESLKQFSRHAEATPILTVRPHYWRDFGYEEERHEWSRTLAELLAPQWLAEPVLKHILNLLEWEFGRADATTQGDECTKPLTSAVWRYIRDGLADIYDWWAEGAAVRPQLGIVFKKNETEWNQPYLQTLIEEQFERPAKPDILTIVPPRVNTYDGHLGVALMQLTAAVHEGLRKIALRTGFKETLREGSRVQSKQYDDRIRFRPGSGHREFFRWYCGRVNAVGWYGGRSLTVEFPSGAFLRGADFSRTTLVRVDFSYASLVDADLYGAQLIAANLRGADLRLANLTDANLTSANLNIADLRTADLTGANLLDANLSDANLRGTYLRRAKLQNADLRGADLRGADLAGADFRDAKLNDADFRGLSLDVVHLSHEQLACIRH